MCRIFVALHTRREQLLHYACNINKNATMFCVQLVLFSCHGGSEYPWCMQPNKVFQRTLEEESIAPAPRASAKS